MSVFRLDVVVVVVAVVVLAVVTSPPNKIVLPSPSSSSSSSSSRGHSPSGRGAFTLVYGRDQSAGSRGNFSNRPFRALANETRRHYRRERTPRHDKGSNKIFGNRCELDRARVKRQGRAVGASAPANIDSARRRVNGAISQHTRLSDVSIKQQRAF